MGRRRQPAPVEHPIVTRSRGLQLNNGEDVLTTSTNGNSTVVSVSAQNSAQLNPNNTTIPKGYKLVLDNVVDNSSDKEQTSTVSSTKSKLKIQVYKGLGDKVSIENWLKRYEMLANFYKWSESEKIVMLGNYLEYDAMNWYIENYNDSDYLDLKN